MELVWPTEAYLPSYVAALERGWSANTLRDEAAREELAWIDRDPAGFLASMVDREAAGPPVTLPDGSQAPRLPGYRRWMWDGEFCGSIGYRWAPGTCALPAHVLGHIGYTVVPWKQGRGYATRALKLLLEDIRAEGMPWVELTTDPDNLASQRVITANGGVLVERFRKPAGYGDAEGLRFRIDLAPGADPDKAILDRMTRSFLQAFSPGEDGRVSLGLLRNLFLPEAVIIKACGPTPEVYSLEAFIAPREKLLNDGTLTEFREEEVTARTDIFGNMACRLSVYRKQGRLNGQAFATNGMKTLHFVRTSAGWRMSALAWDDERAGLTIPDRYLKAFPGTGHFPM